MKKLFCFILMLNSILAAAQSKRMTHWYFGNKAGLDFSSGQPVLDTNGKLFSIEGCSAISDTLGQLLFYAGGTQIFNRNHMPMLNGPIKGDASATEGALIIPLPGSSSRYYVFSSSLASSIPASETFTYSVVDMSMDNGLGGIDTAHKNVPLYQGTEGRAATLHCNKQDYWIIGRTQAHDTLTFYTYLLDSNGVSATPIVQSFHIPGDDIGLVDHFCFSPDGSVLSFSSFYTNIYLFDFNTETGMLSLKDSLSFDIGHEIIYSTAFSPDQTKLYVSYWQRYQWTKCFIAQYDLTSANPDSSRVALDSVYFPGVPPSGYGHFGRMQLGPDGKMYVSSVKIDASTFNLTHDSLNVIQYPDAAGAAAGYQRSFLWLKGRVTGWGLPNFPSNFSLATVPPPPPQCAPLGVVHIQNNDGIEFYPNPFHDHAVLDITAYGSAAYHIVIKDVTGRAYQTLNKYGPGKISIKRDGMPAGLYLLGVYKEGVLIRTEKIVVQ